MVSYYFLAIHFLKLLTLLANGDMLAVASASASDDNVEAEYFQASVSGMREL